MSSDAIAIQVAGLRKGYDIYDRPVDRLLQLVTGRQYGREFLALDDVSFTVPRGETVGIIGRNGSGKSTLLQIISGTLSPTAGTVTVNGKVAALLELGAGFNTEFTGRENVYLSAALYGLSQAETDARFARIAAFADIGDFIDQPVKTYSSGMYVRLAFAVIVHVDAEILIVDEALAVGDIFFVQKCMRFLKEFTAGGGTLLFVSHDVASITSLCSQAILLTQGCITRAGAPSEVVEHYLAQLNELGVKAKGDGAVEAVVETPATAPIAVPPPPVAIDVNEGGFGTGNAVIETVELLDDGKPVSLIKGGEAIRLTVTARMLKPIVQPILGFLIKDRNGQYIFGSNTTGHGDRPQRVAAGQVMTGTFAFPMPYLAAGDYSITVAVSSGTQLDHVHHHWVHDALVFRSAPAGVTVGLIGIPMQTISLTASAS